MFTGKIFAKVDVSIKTKLTLLIKIINMSSKKDLKERMVPKKNINVIEKINSILRFDVETSDEPKKDRPATSNTAQDSMKYDIPYS